ncbi:MAG: ribosome maturation factor RimP [Bacteroidota bacterium]
MPSSTSTDSLTDAIHRLAVAAAAEVSPDAYVVDVEVRGYQGSRVVSVFVDTDEGISLDAAAAVSRALSAALDHDDLVKGRYRLDVSSPGAERPLTQVRQFPRHVGRTLTVNYVGADGEPASVSGELTAADANVLRLAPAKKASAVEISTANLINAKVQLPW